MDLLLGILFILGILVGGNILVHLLGLLWDFFTNSQDKEKYSIPPRKTPKPEYKPPSQPKVYVGKVIQVPRQPSPIVSEKVSDFTTAPPAIPAVIPQPFDYKADWWKKYSRWYREQRGWTCELCQISLHDNQSYLHTHHMWGTQHSDPDDLQALCIACHSEQPGSGHQRFKNQQDYHEFMEKYGEQWRLRKSIA